MSEEDLAQLLYGDDVGKGFMETNDPEGRKWFRDAAGFLHPEGCTEDYPHCFDSNGNHLS